MQPECLSVGLSTNEEVEQVMLSGETTTSYHHRLRKEERKAEIVAAQEAPAGCRGYQESQQGN